MGWESVAQCPGNRGGSRRARLATAGQVLRQTPASLQGPICRQRQTWWLHPAYRCGPWSRQALNWMPGARTSCPQMRAAGGGLARSSLDAARTPQARGGSPSRAWRTPWW
jgi:hypothetical protein